MADKPTDPAPPKAGSSATQERPAPASRGSDKPDHALTGLQSDVRLSDGTTVTSEVQPDGTQKIVNVAEAAVNPGVADPSQWPNPEYGLRPQPFPGPSASEVGLTGADGLPEAPSLQDRIMARAQAQADAIVAAAEAEVKRLDKAEKAAAEAAAEAEADA